FVPVIPVLSVLVCLGLMAFLPFDTWIRLLVWLLIGLDIYDNYGVKKSKMNAGKKHFKDKVIIGICGIAVSILLLIMAILHHFFLEGGDDLVFFYVSIVIGVFHLIYFIYKYLKDKKLGRELNEI